MSDDTEAKNPIGISSEDCLTYEEDEPIHKSFEERENPYNLKKFSPIHEEYRELSLNFPEISEYDASHQDKETTAGTGTTAVVRKKMQRYLERKAERKEKRKIKKKIRQEKLKMSSLTRPPRPSTQLYSMANSTNKQTIIIDLSYEEFMNEKGMAKCANQVARSYSQNRRCPNPVQLHICSFRGKMKTEISKIDGSDKWDIYFHEKDYLHYFRSSQLVYLTSDSQHVLNKLDPSKIYVIGGFVDHNLHKGVSFFKAKGLGLQTARLPLDTNVLLSTSPVLAINHVFEILLAVSNGATWRDAIQTAIPPRKIQAAGIFKRHGMWHFDLERNKREISEDDNSNPVEEKSDELEEKVDTTEEISSSEKSLD